MNKLSVPMRVILLKALIARSSRGSSWPWGAADFEYYGKAVSEAIELLTAKFPTSGKPVLLGFSGGGIMAYYQAINHGEQYSYIFLISGQLSYDQLDGGDSRPGALVYAYHGKSDSVLGIGGGKAAIKILQEQAVKVTFTEFDAGHHGIFEEMKTQITQAVEEKITSLNLKLILLTT